jgi:hypothetical protein
MKLDKAIDNFYGTFADLPIPEYIDGCEHCLNKSEIQKLLSQPLRELSSEDLAPYASSAFLTVGDVTDYLYFVPRILEISMFDDSWWPDIEVTARAICTSGLSFWPETRRAALTSLLKVFIEHIVDTGEFVRIDGWLCAIGRMEIDVRPYLAIIEKDPKAVLAYWKDNAGKLNEGKLGNAFWELPNKEHDVIVEWLRSDRVSRIYADTYGYKP